jgi:hypothetical protein
MALSPNVGSDRSWVYNVAADVSDGEAISATLAIRFANSDSQFFFFPSFVFPLISFFRCFFFFTIVREDEEDDDSY